MFRKISLALILLVGIMPAALAADVKKGGVQPAKLPRVTHLLKPGEKGYSQSVAKLPPDFNVPIFPNSKFESANEIVADGRRFFARFIADAPCEDVAEWYANDLKACGWTMVKKPQKDPQGNYWLIANQMKPKKVGCAISLNQRMPDKKPSKIKKKESTEIGISVTIL